MGKKPAQSVDCVVFEECDEGEEGRGGGEASRAGRGLVGAVGAENEGIKQKVCIVPQKVAISCLVGQHN